MNIIKQTEKIRYTQITRIFIFLLIGFSTGGVTKLLDIYICEIGDVFSRISVWIFLCTMISICSTSALLAAIHVFCFCTSMIAGYYIAADFTNNVYSLTFVYGWFIVSLVSPFLGFVVWYARRKIFISKVISFGIIVCMFLFTVLLYDKIRITDLMLAMIAGSILFKNKEI